jgi:hypothetical protein
VKASGTWVIELISRRGGLLQTGLLTNEGPGFLKLAGNIASLLTQAFFCIRLTIVQKTHKQERTPFRLLKSFSLNFDSPTSHKLDRIYFGRRKNGFGRNKGINYTVITRSTFFNHATQEV